VWWFLLKIPATQKAEIDMIMVQAQLGQKMRLFFNQ
jgi:hypothetical protein